MFECLLNLNRAHIQPMVRDVVRGSSVQVGLELVRRIIIDIYIIRTECRQPRPRCL